MMARDTPQQNHLAELGIAVTINKARAMMAAANIPLTIRYKIWKEAAKTAALFDGLMTVEINGVVKSRFQHAFGFNPNFAAHLRTFGEAGTVKTKPPSWPTEELHACLLAILLIMRGTAIGCGTQ
jgi:hypothetical protein